MGGVKGSKGCSFAGRGARVSSFDESCAPSLAEALVSKSTAHDGAPVRRWVYRPYAARPGVPLDGSDSDLSYVQFGELDADSGRGKAEEKKDLSGEEERARRR